MTHFCQCYVFYVYLLYTKRIGLTKIYLAKPLVLPNMDEYDLAYKSDL